MQVTPSPALLEALSSFDAARTEPRPAVPAEAEAPAPETRPPEGPQRRPGPRGHLGSCVDISV